jgi:hypothetical protein
VSILAAIHERDKAQSTALSWATARVGALLSGESEQEFLAFPTRVSLVKRRTALIFKRLQREGRLGSKVLAICAPLLDEIEKALR